MRVVDFTDSDYPELLKQIDSPPKKLYCRGRWDWNIFKNCLAVVGSRRMTAYGAQVTAKLVSEIASAGITIVSGFMYGVDAEAHQAALSGGGKTIAVMPCGINRIHPIYQKKLYQQILKEKGLIISETPGEVSPVSWSYPRRNRIVAGLSQATLVVEAALKSGSLITADLTKKYGRKLFALPGPLNSSASAGTLELIKEGVEMATSAKDVLDYYGLKATPYFGDKNLCSLDRVEEKIITELKREPVEIDTLARLINISVSKIGAKLSFMQLKGLVQQKEGKYYLNLGK